jgi:hypothetical protein
MLLPNGLTSFEPMPYGYRRWNGTIWADSQIDAYNRQVDNIKRYHLAGYNVACQIEVDGLYNLAASFDAAGRVI